MDLSTIDIQILPNPLSIDACYNFVLDKSCGGICLFVGTVRNVNKGETVTHLFFETYEEMAKKEMAKIANSAVQKFGLKKLSMHHRSGHVDILEKAVIIAVSAIHRKECFAACEFAIDELKKTVPIWKKEFLLDGNYWLNAHP